MLQGTIGLFVAGKSAEVPAILRAVNLSCETNPAFRLASERLVDRCGSYLHACSVCWYWLVGQTAELTRATKKRRRFRIICVHLRLNHIMSG